MAAPSGSPYYTTNGAEAGFASGLEYLAYGGPGAFADTEVVSASIASQQASGGCNRLKTVL